METAGELMVELSDVPAGNVTVDLIFNTLSEANGISTEILRELLPQTKIQMLDSNINCRLRWLVTCSPVSNNQYVENHLPWRGPRSSSLGSTAAPRRSNT